MGSGVSIVNANYGQTAIYGDTSQAWTLTNAGTVGGGVGGGHSNASGGFSILATGALSLTNSGTIAGGFGGGSAEYSGGSGGDGVSMSTGTLTNIAGATIVGGMGGGDRDGDGGYTGGLGVRTTGAVSLTNFGRIAGGEGGKGEYEGAAGGGGVSMSGGTLTNMTGATIVGGAGNYGFLYGNDGGFGVSIAGFGTVVNQKGAEIAGGDGASYYGAGGTGIVLTAGGSVANAGTITGGISGLSNALDYYPSSVGVLFEGSANSTLTNSGTISGVGGEAVQFADGNDRLILLGGSKFSGGVDGGTGSNTIELAASGTSGTVHGLGGATGSGFSEFQTIIVDAGAQWTASGTVLTSAATLAVNGSLTLAGTTLLASKISGTGTLTVAGTTTLAAGTTLSVANLIIGGAVTVDGSPIYAGSWRVASDGTLSVASGKALTFTKGGEIDGTVSGAGNLALTGGITTVEAGANITVGRVVVSNGASLNMDFGPASLGTITVAAGSMVSGDYALTIGKAQISGTVSATILNLDAATIYAGASLLGVRINVGTMTMNASLTIAGTLQTTKDSLIAITAGKTLTLTDGATLGGRVTGAGTLALADAKVSTTAQLKMADLALTGKAALTVKANLAYAGEVTEAAGSKISIAASKTLTFTGAVAGSGALDIGAGSTLITKETVAAAETAAFTAKTGTLRIVDMAGFMAGISGFVSGDRIDIDNSAFKFGTGETLTFIENAAKTKGTLVLKNGDNRLALHLFGQYVAQGFQLSGDGHGGTLITYQSQVAEATNHLATGGHG